MMMSRGPWGVSAVSAIRIRFLQRPPQDPPAPIAASPPVTGVHRIPL
jgi:hypothetical protein